MSGFSKIEQADILHFRELIGAEWVLDGLEEREGYGHDYTEDLSFPPEVVLLPENTEQVSAILQYCSERIIPVTAIGAQTGLSGGALSVFGGVGLSMKRFDSILDIDEQNLQVRVQPGVITQVIQDAVAEKGLFYPPDPASRGSCFIGGNLAESSGGPRAVKYGVTRDYVLNLEVVLADGAVIRTGADVLKNATGYDLTHLMVGSEGTLGIITEAVLKLIPMPKHEMLMLVPFDEIGSAAEAVSAVFRAGITPSAMEFMERDALVLVDRMFEMDMDIPRDVAAHLLVEVDGNHTDVLERDCEAIYEVMMAHGAGEILLAQSSSEKERLWKARRRIGEATKLYSVYKEEDTVVPRFALPQLLAAVKSIGKRYGFNSVCYGHAGDGNLHVNILKEEMSEEAWEVELPKAIRELFQKVKELGGTISGEHGIGLVQREYLDVVFDEPLITLQKGLKRAFDPKGILNPGKIFSLES